MKQRLWKAILLVAIGVSVVSSLFVVLSPVKTAHAAPTRAAINCPGQTLSPGQTWLWGTDIADITTCRGNNVFLFYQGDGNLVLYCNGGNPENALWASNTDWGGGNGDHASFQTDGNLVVYNHNIFGAIVAAWASNTNGKGATGLVLQGDANLVIYRGSPTPSNALWASGTNGRC